MYLLMDKAHFSSNSTELNASSTDIGKRLLEYDGKENMGNFKKPFLLWGSCGRTGLRESLLGQWVSEGEDLVR